MTQRAPASWPAPPCIQAPHVNVDNSECANDNGDENLLQMSNKTSSHSALQARIDDGKDPTISNAERALVKHLRANF